MPDLAQVTSHARALIEDLRAAEALSALAAVPPPPQPSDQELLLARTSALTALEQFRAAYDIACGLLDRSQLGAAERVEAQLWKARILRKASPLCDHALETALAAAAAGEQLGGAAPALAGEAHLEAASLLGRKRCRKLAERELAAAANALPGDPRVAVFAGYLLIDFDERAAARAQFESALALVPRGRRWGRLGLAHVATLAGDFALADQHLAELAPLASGDLWARWLRVRLRMAEHRFSDVVAALEDLLAASPHADAARRHAYDRACALYRAGRLAEAQQAFAELAAAADDRDLYARWARRTTRLLEQPQASARPRRHLQAFPSVAQLRNHCGPASCELYLRFLGVSADQIEIAREIKFPEGGTPVYRVRRYLEKAGFLTRRIEADRARIKKLIDAGVPVLMEEDYSDSRHVAIAVGYDDAREILEVQDPMTHEVRETFYEDLPRIRDLSNDGALVAVHKDDAARLAALDAAGAAECRYMALVDQAWAAYHDQRPADGDQLVAESLAIRRDYELSWFYQFRRARELANAEPSTERKQALYGILDQVTTLWPDDEWPQQFVGEILYFDGRYDEAKAAFERARDRDDPDPYNWSMIADCLLSLGRYDDAYDALAKALERDPAHVRANENLAWVANWRGNVALAWLLNDCARELNPKNPFNYTVQGALLARRADWVGAVQAYEQALALDPERRDAAVERAKMLARLGRIDDAAGALAGRIEKSPDDVGLRIELADLLYANGRPAAAAEVCQAMLARDANVAAGYAILGAALAQQGQLEQGLATLGEALARRPIYGWVYAQKGKYLRQAGRHGEALEAFAAAVGMSRGDPGFEYELGDTLVAAGHGREGVGYMRGAAQRTSLGEGALTRIGALLVEHESGQAAHDFFLDLAKSRPDDLGVARAHAHTLLEVLWVPGIAKPILQKIAARTPDDPYAKAFRGSELFDRTLATEAEGERLLREAIAAGPGLEYPRRMLADRLNDRGQFGPALAVLSDCGSAAATVHERVRALLGQSDLAAAEALIVKFEKEHQDGAGPPSVPALRMRYQLARRQWDWKKALELSEVLSRQTGERDDDGELDYWEQEKFECLAYLAEDERALRFGESQAQSGHDLARLAYTALGADRLALAAELAERALRLAPDDTQALHVQARMAELKGDLETAGRCWRRIGELEPTWHLWHENLARIALGLGDLAQATQQAEAAVLDGHTCPHAFAVRAQARLLAGDRAGARADTERSYLLAKPESREHEDEGTWAVHALLHGERERADALFKVYLRDGAPISKNDRARVARVREST
ncbi:MAG TPA: C39 family peptidase [Polyangia bacterium]|nr:C39 family peptidase [Polyangia bacterium]